MAFRKVAKTLLCSSSVALNDYKQSNSSLNLAQDKYLPKSNGGGCDSLVRKFVLHPETVAYSFNKAWDSKNANNPGRKTIFVSKLFKIIFGYFFNLRSN